MNKQKVILVILVLLISIKFVFLPWGDWSNERQEAAARLSNFNDKQQQVIENESLIQEQFDAHQQSLLSFIKNIPTIKAGDKANTLWFSLVDSIKTEGVKVYNQNVEFEEYVTDDVGYVTGKFFISGEPNKVMQAVLMLEAKAPYVFLEQLKFISSHSKGKKPEKLVTQIYLRYWFSQINKSESE